MPSRLQGRTAVDAERGSGPARPLPAQLRWQPGAFQIGSTEPPAGYDHCDIHSLERSNAIRRPLSGSSCLVPARDDRAARGSDTGPYVDIERAVAQTTESIASTLDSGRR